MASHPRTRNARLRFAALMCAGTALAVAFAVADRAGAEAYTVQKGDTLWAISRHAGVSVRDLADLNHIGNPDLIHPGDQIALPGDQPSAPAAPAPASAPPSFGQARSMLVTAARDQQVDPSLVLAVAYWESGWNQSVTSGAGAVGLMQVTPDTARWAGPALLGRPANPASASDNAHLGAALLHRYLADFGSERLALAAYYQGPTAVRRHGVYPSSEGYIRGIEAVQSRVNAGTL